MLCGTGYDWMLDVSRHIADGVPQGELRVLEGEEHAVPPDVLAPVLEDFLIG